jgi:hypothetical protein
VFFPPANLGIPTTRWVITTVNDNTLRTDLAEIKNK